MKIFPHWAYPLLKLSSKKEGGNERKEAQCSHRPRRHSPCARTHVAEIAADYSSLEEGIQPTALQAALTENTHFPKKR